MKERETAEVNMGRQRDGGVGRGRGEGKARSWRETDPALNSTSTTYLLI